jgi:hypothetical protein
MRVRHWIAAALIGLACAAPAHAEQKSDSFAQIESLLNPKFLLQGVIRDEDVALLFAHLRAALLASYEGREAPPPDALNQRAEAIGNELRARGALAGLLLLMAFEAAAKQAVREALGDAPAAR